MPSGSLDGRVDASKLQVARIGSQQPFRVRHKATLAFVLSTLALSMLAIAAIGMNPKVSDAPASVTSNDAFVMHEPDHHLQAPQVQAATVQSQLRAMLPKADAELAQVIEDGSAFFDEDMLVKSRALRGDPFASAHLAKKLVQGECITVVLNGARRTAVPEDGLSFSDVLQSFLNTAFPCSGTHDVYDVCEGEKESGDHYAFMNAESCWIKYKPDLLLLEIAPSLPDDVQLLSRPELQYHELLLRRVREEGTTANHFITAMILHSEYEPSEEAPYFNNLEDEIYSANMYYGVPSVSFPAALFPAFRGKDWGYEGVYSPINRQLTRKGRALYSYVVLYNLFSDVQFHAASHFAALALGPAPYPRAPVSMDASEEASARNVLGAPLRVYTFADGTPDSVASTRRSDSTPAWAPDADPTGLHGLQETEHGARLRIPIPMTATKVVLGFVASNQGRGKAFAQHGDNGLAEMDGLWSDASTARTSVVLRLKEEVRFSSVSAFKYLLVGKIDAADHVDRRGDQRFKLLDVAFYQ